MRDNTSSNNTFALVKASVEESNLILMAESGFDHKSRATEVIYEVLISAPPFCRLYVKNKVDLGGIAKTSLVVNAIN